jgi:hypothetical protein
MASQRIATGSGRRIVMLTIGFITMVFVLLAIVGVFALMARDSKRRGQSGSRGSGGDAKQGRAAGLD